MALTTTVTPATIAVALGRVTPTGTTAAQWAMWINDALLIISRRASKLGVETIPQDDLDLVIREAVVAQVKKPDDATQVTVQVDDGMTQKSYQSGNGRVTILDEWWDDLGLVAPGGAFEVDLFPKTSPFYVSPS